MPVSEGKSPEKIRRMFSSVSGRYDFFNHLLSANLDRFWRRALINELRIGRGSRVLDVCCGSGDVAIACARRGAEVTGLDFTQAMLDKAAEKTSRGKIHVCWIWGDACALPFADCSFDAVSMAFGLRNIARPVDALRECVRVLQPGGRLGILELCPPQTGMIHGLYRRYLGVIPAAVRMFGGRCRAYRYLGASIETFLSPDKVMEGLLQARALRAGRRVLFPGVAHLFWGEKGG
ncbi:MAG: ubiquinone/menaquinone biosynthesis methyltransferase [Candidatus Omnitrophica bacterium]|nr:ubiquinone/menaquinone biosynthesis methyltransferase [Candidatus Omnitrophota bacterium]